MKHVNVGVDINQDMLEYGSDTAFLLDCQTEFYIWEAAKVKKEKRHFAREQAKRLLEGRPQWTIFEQERQEKEGILFRSKFADWPEPGKVKMMKEILSGYFFYFFSF